MYIVFAQSEDATLPAGVLARNAEAHFEAIATLADTEPAAGDGAHRLELTFDDPPLRAGFVVRIRKTEPSDVAVALLAEQRGDAAGMGALASRCASVWLVEPDGLAPEWAIWECCALLALTAFGPILPPDHSTLLGVRSARLRATRLRHAR